MNLKEFQVKNYRSINDSGMISVSKLTAFLGRNESGKSNLLHALYSLNPVDGFLPLDKNKHFPRHRRLAECTDFTPVVISTWELNEDDRQALADIWLRGKMATSVKIQRNYNNIRLVTFLGLPNQPFDKEKIKKNIQQAVQYAKIIATKVDESPRSTLEELSDILGQSIEKNEGYAINWVSEVKPAFAELRQNFVEMNCTLTEAQSAHFENLETLINDIADDEGGRRNAKQWVLENMPIFMFLDEYPELDGRMNVGDYLVRQENDDSTNADKNFTKMCKVADLNPSELQELLGQGEDQTRNHLANDASALITSEIQRLWKDRPLKVRFKVDGEYINTFISNPSNTNDVEISLNDRSRGFQWFFSFYVTFAADTNGGEATNAIILLDEPGLYLHAKSQRDLLNHLENDFDNQVLYTTHSPFMVPTHKLDSIRTVDDSEKGGTIVSNDLSSDSRTLFPLQAALGYDLAQSLFIGSHNLVVEGVTDFWVLSSISEYLLAKEKTGLNPDITITPAGGAQKISYMVALLWSENLKVVALLDHEQGTMKVQNDLAKTKLIKNKNIVFVSESFGNSPPKEADIEDLLDPAIYENLVRESYVKELKGVNLQINNKIPRIAKRFEDAFKKVDIRFNKTRPLNLLLEKMSKTPDTIVTEDVADRFSTLFTKINILLAKK